MHGTQPFNIAPAKDCEATQLVSKLHLTLPSAKYGESYSTRQFYHFLTKHTSSILSLTSNKEVITITSSIQVHTMSITLIFSR